MSNNPYNSPTESDLDSGTSQNLTNESKANLRFAAKIAAAVSAISVLAVFYTAYITYSGITELNAIYGQWMWLHYLTAIRSLYILALAAFSLIAFRAAGSMREIANTLPNDAPIDWDRHAANTTWLWIGLSLFVVISFFEMAARYSMIYFGNA